MRIPILSVLTLFLLAAPAHAGYVTGKISVGDKSVGAKILVEVLSGKKVIATAKTDKHSSYRMYVKEPGDYTIKVTYKGQSPTMKITVTEKTIRYDLVLELKDNKYRLKRK